MTSHTGLAAKLRLRSRIQHVEQSNGNGDVALLVDWENLKYSLAQRGQQPNVAALRSAAERFGRIVYARAYADWQEPNHRDEARGLYMAGIEPVYVPTKRYHDGTGDVRVKDSVDVKLTADCIEASHQYDQIGTFIIVSGDHGFLHVVNTLRPRGKQVVVVGVSWTTARQLTEPADVVLYYDIDVDRPLSEAAPEPSGGSATPQKVPPQIAQAADTVAGQVSAADSFDKRAVADALQVAMTVVREFREASRDLSVSSLGQEMAKRMAPVTYAQQVKGKLAVLVRSLAANGLVRLAPRDLQEYLYLPDETLPEPERTAPSEPVRFNVGDYMYSDLRADQKAAVIKAIDALQRNPHLDYLTFKRIQKSMADALGRDEFGVHNLTNSLISFGVLKVAGKRRELADGGYPYEFDTFALDSDHEDVRRALG